MEQNIEKRRVENFLVITFVLTYMLELSVLYPALKNANGNAATVATTVISLVSFIPAIAVIMTRLFTREGFKNCYIRPKMFRKKWGYYLLGWFGPTVLVIFGVVLFFCIFPGRLDLSLNYFKKIYNNGYLMVPSALKRILVLEIIEGVLLSPILNFILCIGIEWGWRGYLLIKLKSLYGNVKAVLACGVLWGLCFMPLTCMGYGYGMNYIGYPFLGIFARIVFSIFVGAILSFLTLKSGSCIPAVLAHGALNGVGSIGTYIAKNGEYTFVGPSITGIIGGMGIIIAGTIVILLFRKEDIKEKEANEKPLELTI